MPHKVVMANTLAHNSLFTHPADTEQDYHSFVATDECKFNIPSPFTCGLIFINSRDKYLALQLQDVLSFFTS